VFLFPGSVTKIGDSKFNFEPMVKSSTVSGTIDYGQVVQKSFFGTQLVPYQGPRYATGADYTIAAHISGQTVAAPGDTTKANIIFVSDMDFVSDQFFEIRRRGMENLNFDNVSFFLNCIDVLTGDNSFVDLRRHRVQYRTLTTVEARTRAYADKRAKEEQQARTEAESALAEAQHNLDGKVAALNGRSDLDATTKQIMARNLQESESRKFDANKTAIEADRDAKIERSREDMESQVRRIQSGIKTLAGLLPPIPVFAIGIYTFMRRQRREREGTEASRRLRG